MRTPAFVATAAGILASLAAFAQGPVYSVNIVGFQKISAGPSQFIMGSTPFIPANTSIQSVLGPGLDGGASPAQGDKIYFWDNVGSTYREYFLYDGGPGDPDNGKWFDSGYGDPVDTLSPGSSFFLQNAVGGATNTVTVVGDVVMSAQTTKTIQPGFNQIAYGFSTSRALNDLNFVHNPADPNSPLGTTSPATADQVYIWNPATSNYETYFLYYDGSTDPENNSWLDSGFGLANVTIEPGQGFWYFRQGSTTVTWVENRPY